MNTAAGAAGLFNALRGQRTSQWTPARVEPATPGRAR